MKIKELKVLNMTEPCGIGDSPYFSWIIESDRQDTVQTVYSLVVKSSNSVVWDTGKVECSKNSFIPYKGKMLKSRCRYSVQITIWDNYGNEAAVTRTVTVEPVRQADTVKPSGKIVYLTFDDGPGEYTSKLLDILSKYNVKATFFTVGSGHPDLLKAEADAGHSIGIHSATHDYSKIYASEDAFFADLRKQQDTIENATGIRTTLVRFPGGSSNTVSKSYCSGIMTKLTKDLTDMGYQYFDWNVTSGDAGETTSTSVVVQNVISGIQQHDVSIVLQHDIKGFSVNAVEQIIQWGLAHGYTFLPLTAESPTAHHGVNN